MNTPIEILEDARRQIVREYEAKLREMDDAIAKVRETQAGECPNISVMPGEFTGLRPSDALKNYLCRRGGTVTLKDAFRDLQRGGTKFGPSIDRAMRNLKISVSKNTDVFDYDEKSGTVRLK